MGPTYVGANLREFSNSWIYTFKITYKLSISLFSYFCKSIFASDDIPTTRSCDVRI